MSKVIKGVFVIALAVAVFSVAVEARGGMVATDVAVAGIAAVAGGAGLSPGAMLGGLLAAVYYAGP